MDKITKKTTTHEITHDITHEITHDATHDITHGIQEIGIHEMTTITGGKIATGEHIATTHICTAGETIDTIAAAHHTTVDAIRAANPDITDYEHIIAGTTIHIK